MAHPAGYPNKYALAWAGFDAANVSTDADDIAFWEAYATAIAESDLDALNDLDTRT